MALSKQGVVHASLILIAANILSRGLGFCRELVCANAFGASREYDLYLIAMTFPVTINSILMYAIPAVVVPAYIRADLDVSGKAADRFAVSFLNLILVVLLSISALLAIGADTVVMLYAPGLCGAELVITIKLLRITSGIVFLGGGFAYIKSILNAQSHFTIPSLAPLMLNLAIILSIVNFAPTFGVSSMAYGMLTGNLLQLAVVLPLVFIYGPKYFPRIEFKNIYVRRAMLAAIPIVAVELLGQLFAVVDRGFVERLPYGAISAMNYANTWTLLVVGGLGITVGTALFPSISSAIGKGDNIKLQQLLDITMKYVLLIVTPLVMVFTLFAGDFIKILLQRGAFSVQAVSFTSSALTLLSPGIFAVTLHSILIKVFYSFGNIKKILLASSSALCVKIVLSFLLVADYSFKGLAVSTMFASYVNITILISMLALQLKWNPFRGIKMLIVHTVLAATAGWGAAVVMHKVRGEGGIVPILTFCVIYGLCSLILSNRTYRAMLAYIRKGKVV